MKNLFKPFKAIIFIVLYLLYFTFTLRQRNMYFAAKNKGMDCVGVKGGLFSDTYEFNPSKLPEKRYLTFKQCFDNWYVKPWTFKKHICEYDYDNIVTDSQGSYYPCKNQPCNIISVKHKDGKFIGMEDSIIYNEDYINRTGRFAM